MPRQRVIKQMAVVGCFVVALADDNTVWRSVHSDVGEFTGWAELPGLPPAAADEEKSVEALLNFGKKDINA